MKNIFEKIIDRSINVESDFNSVQKALGIEIDTKKHKKRSIFVATGIVTFSIILSTLVILVVISSIGQKRPKTDGAPLRITQRFNNYSDFYNEYSFQNKYYNEPAFLVDTKQINNTTSFRLSGTDECEEIYNINCKKEESPHHILSDKIYLFETHYDSQKDDYMRFNLYYQYYNSYDKRDENQKAYSIKTNNLCIVETSINELSNNGVKFSFTANMSMVYAVKNDDVYLAALAFGGLFEPTEGQGKEEHEKYEKSIKMTETILDELKDVYTQYIDELIKS